MIIAGGGVQYSRAVAELTAFAEAHGIPVVETIAGRANMLANIRSTSARRRHRLGQRQCDRRKGRCDPRRGHAAAGFHHRLLDRLRQGRAIHRAQRRAP
jgi:hypothetical protein